MSDEPAINTDTWVDRYGDALFRFALARINDHATAEDLVQETFLAAVKASEKFKGRSSEKTWLFAILKHKVVDHFRRSKAKYSGKEVSIDAESTEAFFNANGGWRIRPEHWRSDPGKAQQTKEFLDHFYRCLAELPPRNADAFVYREIDGLSTREICNILGISANNSWVILYRARMMLRRCLELAGFGTPKRGKST